ncbi:hypothetical protein CROQUDRAFT_59666 [Cronartium quercuum f. sp. fusiforme G11]|uniref:Neutral ceramidase n=1 Tax=Cronartium quercuum f. sp. fusiforme G11 TaxID=708437 RepID=A0A9P6NL94_9BASI|nr:hypothetical protein CROQUDRAFT_59666 [Cronartium quercuum f. sp. fusiforme G11]
MCLTKRRLGGPMELALLLSTASIAFWVFYLLSVPELPGIPRLPSRKDFQASRQIAFPRQAKEDHVLGLGIADITGPIVEVELMGYANEAQVGTGLHMRLRSRAFIVANESGGSRWVMINADVGMGDTAIRRGVVERLQVMYPGLYSDENVALVGTHSHSGVAGFIQTLLPQIPSKGFVKQNYEAIVSGTVLAVKRAHENLAPGRLSIGNMSLLDTNINRSPWAYQHNPEEERRRYEYDVDKDFHLVKFGDALGTHARGFMSFFAVHGTSVFKNNTLIGSDNKGMAAYLYEASVEPNSMPGNNSFVAGFLQSNVGDTTPNTLGAYCESGPDEGKLCSFEKSLCGGRTEPCQGRGPGFPGDSWESNRIIGQNQKEAASNLMNQNLTLLKGSVKAVYTTVDMSGYTFSHSNGSVLHTCPPALGYAFAGGTTDGAGAFDFYQGNNQSRSSQNPLWQFVGSFVGGPPSAVQSACHAPKPILLNTGNASLPYEWSPKVVDIQIFKVGQLVILIVPGEFTTMAGRRIRETVRAQLISEGVLGEEAVVILTGPANTYTHYVSTKEEYGAQRYEGASTIYGPNTLGAYIDIYKSLVGFLLETNQTEVPKGPGTPDLRSKALCFVPGVLFDGVPFGSFFGKVLKDVDSNRSYYANDTVQVKFQGANPRNNLLLEDSYLKIQRLADNDTWQDFRSDSHPSTRFEWKRGSTLLGTSTVKFFFFSFLFCRDIESPADSGTYQIMYKGHSKAITGRITEFLGRSSRFQVQSFP